MRAALVLAVGWFYFWTAVPEWEPGLIAAKDDGYYNLLTRGFLRGHVYLDLRPDPYLATLANPWDPAARGPHGMPDTSYYRGKVLQLFWRDAGYPAFPAVPGADREVHQRGAGRAHLRSDPASSFPSGCCWPSPAPLFTGARESGRRVRAGIGTGGYDARSSAAAQLPGSPDRLRLCLLHGRAGRDFSRGAWPPAGALAGPGKRRVGLRGGFAPAISPRVPGGARAGLAGREGKRPGRGQLAPAGRGGRDANGHGRPRLGALQLFPLWEPVGVQPSLPVVE